MKTVDASAAYLRRRFQVQPTDFLALIIVVSGVWMYSAPQPQATALPGVAATNRCGEDLLSYCRRNTVVRGRWMLGRGRRWLGANNFKQIDV